MPPTTRAPYSALGDDREMVQGAAVVAGLDEGDECGVLVAVLEYRRMH